MDCTLCDCTLGDKELAHYQDERAYCPQCFVWHVAPEGTRFQAVECFACGCISVDVGTRECGQCGQPVRMVLPQKAKS